MKLAARDGDWIVLDRVDSTNSYLMNEGRDYPSGTVVLAREQTAGRGRGGRAWQARPGDAFVFSGLVHLNKSVLPPGRMLLMPLLCGIAVLRGAGAAMNRFTPDREHDVFSIKWPNDIYMLERSDGPTVERSNGWGKLAGILVETDVRGDDIRFILGVGLNWRGPPDPDAEYRVAPAALFEEGVLDNDALDDDEPIPEGEAFAEFFIAAFNERVGQLLRPEAPDFMREIRENFYLKDRMISMGSRAYQVLDLSTDGALVLRDVNSGEKTLVYDAPEDMQVI